MNHDKITLLIIIQFILITGAFFSEVNNQLSLAKLVLYGTLLFVTIVLLLLRIRFIRRLKQMTSEIRRAVNGNLKTRLFANEDDFFNEVMFATNELIEQLEKNQIQTIQSETERKRLLSSISHDIRTPLTSIIGYVDALKDGIADTDEERKEYLEIISRKSNNLKQLIDEIFNMAKLDADEIPMQLETIDVSEIIKEVLIEYLPEIKKNELELKLTLPETKCLIETDYLSIIRIIGNLIKNAILYGKGGKVLGIEIIETSQEFQILIWDHGPGILKCELDRVFERMYRGDQSRNSEQGGSGLGLAIAKALIEKNNGRIWVESVPWKRTVFGVAFCKN
ncbi:sensor histidine kinase [Bacillus manliponensis]|uniref:sensor histidine kinase n=1 Tax=Bacillus manliponensis TaxID=574376 RepID=UPI003517B5CB